MAFSLSRTRGRATARLELEVLEERCLLDASNPAAVALPPSNSYGAQRTDQLLQQPLGNPQVLFMGDSITEFYQDGAGAPVWNSFLAPLGAADIGVYADTTSNVLWQIANGQLKGIDPKVVVLMIGGNNIDGGQSPGQTAQGIAAVVQAIQQFCPNANILLVGVLTQGASIFNYTDYEIALTNYSAAANIANGKNVFYLDVSPLFLEPTGATNLTMTLDGLHPSTLGYLAMVEAELPLIQALEQPGAPGLLPDTYALPSTTGVALVPV